MSEKPRIFLDVKSDRLHSFSNRDRQVALSGSYSHSRVFGFVKFAAVIVVILSFVLGFAIAPQGYEKSLAVAANTSSERANLEKELAELEAQMQVYSAQAAQYRHQGNTLQSEIDRLDGQIAQLERQIRTITLTLDKLSDEIVETESTIITTEERLDQARSAVANTLQYVYEKDQESLVAVLLKNPNLSDFFSEVNDLLDVQGTLSEKIKEMTNLRDNLLEEKELLALQKDDAIKLAQFQAEQKKSVLSTKIQKDDILEETRGKEAVYQDLYVKTKQSADEIRSRIFRLLGGGEMTFQQAYDYAKYSSGLTGVRPAFLLAILQQESALGKNVGKCHYQGAMAPGPPTSRRDDITPFLQITAELGLDPDQTLVSCAISTDGAYGGAMGPSQFIPTTWMYYKDRVSKLTGNSPASPWNNGDAFVATGLYISDAMNSCSQYSGTDQERCAAARYYAGGNWQTHLWTYGERVISRAAQFEADIEIIR